ncbi:hypothetical protein [Desulfosoma caldarium]|uniref:Uncharacterized protein n=1 Tax=Desulfosoma caldarium TaxID=610254 RepID=A0A3N1URY4_9BACT|nr:hypothetical protein [Desulfosoma caldarium]ROQ89846.1 hypothetical protein EDC27_2962 [Desulfosoma caldarium]
MKDHFRVVAVMAAIVIGLCWSAQAQVMPMLVAQQVFDYSSRGDPVVLADSAVVQPIRVGPVAEGGRVVRVRVSLAAFPAPVNLYLGIMAPALDPFHLYLVKPDGELMIYEPDLVVWKLGVTQ